AVAGSDGRIYAIGGADASTTPLATVNAYTPSSNSWATVASLTTARSALAGTQGSDGRLYAIGGKSATAPTNVVEAFTAGSRRWNTVANMLTMRSALAAALGA